MARAPSGATVGRVVGTGVTTAVAEGVGTDVAVGRGINVAVGVGGWTTVRVGRGVGSLSSGDSHAEIIMPNRISRKNPAITADMQICANFAHFIKVTPHGQERTDCLPVTSLIGPQGGMDSPSLFHPMSKSRLVGSVRLGGRESESQAAIALPGGREWGYSGVDTKEVRQYGNREE